MNTNATELPVARSALEDCPAVSGAVSLREMPLRGKLTLRGNPDDPAFSGAVLSVCGCDLPTVVGDAGRSEALSVTCLGPDEWMVHCPLDDTESRLGQLTDAIGSAHAALVDVSDYFTEIELSGERTRDVLAKLTPLDVSSAALASGTVVTTRMAKASVLLHMAADDSALIQVRWSHAEYLWDYLVEAAREYNC